MFKLTRPLHRSAAAAMLACAAFSAPTQAMTLLDFEPPSLTGLYLAGESFEQAGYQMNVVYDAATVDVASGLGEAAPTGNASQFYTQLNEGALHLSRPDGMLFTMHGFDAAFVPLVPAAAGQTAIAVVATYADNTTDGFAWLFDRNFASYNTDFNAYSNVKSLDFFACSFDGANVCTSPLQNNGQFAIDNISVTAVPEPSAAALLGLGLAALLLRRRAAAL
jgi:hypothetical protein